MSRQVGDRQRAGDRVVVGDRHEVHPAALGELVDLFGRRGALGQVQRALDAELRQLRGRRVDMHVCAAMFVHGYRIRATVCGAVKNEPSSCDHSVNGRMFVTGGAEPLQGAAEHDRRRARGRARAATGRDRAVIWRGSIVVTHPPAHVASGLGDVPPSGRPLVATLWGSPPLGRTAVRLADGTVIGWRAGRWMVMGDGGDHAIEFAHK